jgi:hypothetical protein
MMDLPAGVPALNALANLCIHDLMFLVRLFSRVHFGELTTKRVREEFQWFRVKSCKPGRARRY